MSDSYKHIVIEKELLRNDRRTRKMTLPQPERADLYAHGQVLFNGLNRTLQQVKQEQTPTPDNYILKLNYTGNLDFSHLHKHGIQFISQEGQQMCVVFSDDVCCLQ